VLNSAGKKPCKELGDERRFLLSEEDGYFLW